MRELVHLRDCCNVSLDIECLGLKPTAPVLSIGVVCAVDGQEFSYYEAVQDTVGIPELGTVLDWMQQPGAASLAKSCHGPLPGALDTLADYLSDCTRMHRTAGGTGELRIWTRGVFDTPILEHKYEQLNRPVPWRYYQVIDLRSLSMAFPTTAPERDNDKTPLHHALGDARYQHYHMQAILKELP